LSTNPRPRATSTTGASRTCCRSNSELGRSGAWGFHFFSFTPFGLPILLLGILKQQPAAGAAQRPSLRGWIQSYQLAAREYRLRISDGSPLAGKKLEALDLRHSSGARGALPMKSSRRQRRPNCVRTTS